MQPAEAHLHRHLGKFDPEGRFVALVEVYIGGSRYRAGTLLPKGLDARVLEDLWRVQYIRTATSADLKPPPKKEKAPQGDAP